MLFKKNKTKKQIFIGDNLLLLIYGMIISLFCFTPLAMAVETSELHDPIVIYDEDGVNVLDSGRPYSPKKTCGGDNCHDYDTMTHSIYV